MNDHHRPELVELEDSLRAALYPQGTPRRVGPVTRALAARAVPRQGHDTGAAAARSGGPRHWNLPSVIALTVSIAVACGVAIGALSLGHPAATHRPGTAVPGVAGLLQRLAVLRRAQTPADRAYPAELGQHVRPGLGGVITKLTRLAATVTTPTAGRVRIFVVVRQLPSSRFSAPGRAGAAAITVVTVATRGRTEPVSHSQQPISTPRTLSPPACPPPRPQLTRTLGLAPASCPTALRG